MVTIAPFIWFDNQAKQAADIYSNIFPNTRIKNIQKMYNTPSGTVEIITMDIMNQEFTLMNAGPFFKFNPAISFTIKLTDKDQIKKIWNNLVSEGSVLMELATYPFSELFGWVGDKFGVTWQLQYSNEPCNDQKVTISLMFVKDICGKAEEALTFYTGLFKNSTIGDVLRYDGSETTDKEGTIKHASFILENSFFSIMDSSFNHDFSFNEAISIQILCKTQKEIDYYWDNLTADPKAEQCGWLKDKYGVSWQVAPDGFNEFMSGPDKEKISRITKVFLQMKKIDLDELNRLYNIN